MFTDASLLQVGLTNLLLGQEAGHMPGHLRLHCDLKHQPLEAYPLLWPTGDPGMFDCMTFLNEWMHSLMAESLFSFAMSTNNHAHPPVKSTRVNVRTIAFIYQILFSFIGWRRASPRLLAYRIPQKVCLPAESMMQMLTH